MDGYILQGTSGEYLLVIRSQEEADIIHIIDRVAASRKKSVKELAVELEKSLNDDGSRRDSSEARSKDKTKSSNSNRSGRKKAVNSKHRTKPSS
jgi:hypothetical protein